VSGKVYFRTEKAAGKGVLVSGQDWMMGGSKPTPQRVQSGYDVMQVCLNGHRITDGAASMPEFRKAFCAECGAKTIMDCPECHAPIQGHYNSPGVLSFRETPVPNNCQGCGTAYPWRQDALVAAIEAAQLDLNEQDAAAAAALVPTIATDNPRTEIAAMKLRKLLGKMSKPAYDVAIKVVGDVAAATAKSHLGL